MAFAAPKRIKIDDGCAQALRTALLDDPVRVQRNYLQARMSDAGYLCPPREYLKHAQWFADRQLMCPESPAIGITADDVAPLANALLLEQQQAVSMLHMGFAGAASPIHFDWDFRWVLHVNLIGRKHLTVFPPDEGARSQVVINSLPYDLGELADTDRRALLRWLNAKTYSLGPGDAVVFPPLWWHAATYDRPSLSLSFRYNELVALRPLAALPRSANLQRLGWLLSSEASSADRATIVDSIARLFLAPARTWRIRYDRFLTGLSIIETELRKARGLPEAPTSGIPWRLQSELHVAKGEVRFAYDWPKGSNDGCAVDDAAVGETINYLFKGAEGSSLTYDERLDLASYATTKRQGLRPLRGVLSVGAIPRR